MAILLHEEGLLDRTRIYATDMNEIALQRADVDDVYQHVSSMFLEHQKNGIQPVTDLDLLFGRLKARGLVALLIYLGPLLRGGALPARPLYSPKASLTPP